ncbi:MAG: hypothetical protein HY709_02745 [Candidatus Latescibacteria bacterium]|nr:hypothetical protein [Candidatus Latescibacterota bacterium]
MKVTLEDRVVFYVSGTASIRRDGSSTWGMRKYLDTFCRVCRDRSIPNDIPNTVSVADICRPEWLCEIEAIAICPAER